MPMFAGVEITERVMQLTREHFIQIYLDAIAEANLDKPDDPDRLINYYLDQIELINSGESERTFTFLQRAHWIQTGQMVPLLSK